MASIKFDEYKVKLNNLGPVLDDLGVSLGMEAAIEELDLLQAQSAADDFWSNMEKAQKVSQRIKNLQDKIEAQNKRVSTVEDLLVLCEMALRRMTTPWWRSWKKASPLWKRTLKAPGYPPFSVANMIKMTVC